MDVKILLSGTGGQGIISAGEFLSEALFNAGYEVVNTRSYGTEARGGSSRSEILVSDGEIYEIEVGETDILVAMSTPAYRRYINRAKRGSLVLVEEDVLADIGEKELRGDVELISIPANKTASSLGNPIVANMVMLGALSKRTNLITLEGLKEAVNTLMRPHLREINIKALELGYQKA
ncbi:MAG: 2-oxoacid:acceptor oxidoreductase family protein [Candidatus Bathyarchaeia archaeon]|nr:2-oxoacid:acceptor oxidoreductase family protein [Candidatus Bathyarchaeota archaeon]